MFFHLRIEPYDPIIARDGRPFGAAAGNRMKTLEWLYPSVLAGSIRTIAGKRAALDFDEDAVALLTRLEVHGPVASREDQLFFPLPYDLVRHPVTKQFSSARPAGFASHESWDLAEPGVIPALLPEDLAADFKPDKLPMLWSTGAAARWLGAETADQFQLDENETIARLERSERTHAAIDAATGAAEDSMLFTTEGIEFPAGLHMSARIAPPPKLEPFLRNLDQLHSVGGERRLARFSIAKGNGWECPLPLSKRLVATKKVRMQLVTPAIFDGGWRPQWITEPEQSGTRLKLVSAAMSRWRPVSGWSYAKPTGPKPVRRMAPAGSVYFFETEETPAKLPDLWLAPVSDRPQDRRDGFGLAIWGVW